MFLWRTLPEKQAPKTEIMPNRASHQLTFQGPWHTCPFWPVHPFLPASPQSVTESQLQNVILLKEIISEKPTPTRPPLGWSASSDYFQELTCRFIRILYLNLFLWIAVSFKTGAICYSFLYRQHPCKLGISLEHSTNTNLKNICNS